MCFCNVQTPLLTWHFIRNRRVWSRYRFYLNWFHALVISYIHFFYVFRNVSYELKIIGLEHSSVDLDHSLWIGYTKIISSQKHTISWYWKLFSKLKYGFLLFSFNIIDAQNCPYKIAMRSIFGVLHLPFYQNYQLA